MRRLGLWVGVVRMGVDGYLRDRVWEGPYRRGGRGGWLPS